MSKIDLKLGDSVEVLKTISNDSIDLVVTSPPYDNLRSYAGSLEWNFSIFTEIANELSRVLKPGGIIVWIVGDATVKGSETGSSFRQALYFKDACGLNLHDTMIWDKESFSAVGSLSSRYAPVFEYMFVLSKGKPNIFNPIKDRFNKWAGTRQHGTVVAADGTSRPQSGIKKNKVIAEVGQRHNVWRISPEKNSKNIGHPAMYPISLVEDHIKSWSNIGDLVLDPFMGSGTTGVACNNLGRDFIGIEKVQEYYDISKERLNHESHSRV